MDIIEDLFRSMLLLLPRHGHPVWPPVFNLALGFGVILFGMYFLVSGSFPNLRGRFWRVRWREEREPITRQDAPIRYWFNITWWFVFGIFLLSRGWPLT